jgi:hypothetical protein
MKMSSKSQIAFSLAAASLPKPKDKDIDITGDIIVNGNVRKIFAKVSSKGSIAVAIEPGK